ncbi:MAG: hypothetical protein ACI8Y7_000335 [Candidatus Woesearchaeota archaeon]|jgi:hypothetical protein
MRSHIEVPKHKAFVRVNGEHITTLKTLLDTLYIVSNNEFAHHVNELKNDYANWVESSVGHDDLAKKIKRAKNRHQILTILENELEYEQDVQAKTQRVPRKSAVQKVFGRRPHIKTEEEEAVRLDLHEQIHHLNKHTNHLTQHHKHTTSDDTVSVEEEVHKRLVDWVFGFIIGLVMGFLLAKSLGIIQ